MAKLGRELTPSEQINGLSKYVYANIVYKVCKECGIFDGKFCHLLRRTICSKCSKFEKFQMISLKNAEAEYRLTKTKIEERGVKGLVVPNSYTNGASIIVYFKTEIRRICDLLELPDIAPRSMYEEAKRDEMIYYMQKNRIKNPQFLKLALENDQSYANRYINGQSGRTAIVIAQLMIAHYRKFRSKRNLPSDSECEPSEEEPEQHSMEVEPDQTETQAEVGDSEETPSLPVKRSAPTGRKAAAPRKLNAVKAKRLVDGVNFLRKKQLQEKLETLGAGKVNLDDKDSLGYQFITGTTDLPLTKVALTLMRESLKSK